MRGLPYMRDDISNITLLLSVDFAECGNLCSKLQILSRDLGGAKTLRAKCALDDGAVRLIRFKVGLNAVKTFEP